MIWKEYLKINFKKPIEDESIKSIRSKKKIFESSIEKCYSRLETIEICTSNSKNEDAILLSKALFIDIYNLNESIICIHYKIICKYFKVNKSL